MRKEIVIKQVPLHLLKPYENNSKIHTVTQLEGIAQSIEQFGFKQPIVIDKDNVIIAGHGRYEAAASLGYESLPCIIADDLNEKQIRAYRILDNKLAEGMTDYQKLELELEELDFDFEPFKVEFPDREWSTDIDLSDKHGEHTDGIQGKITIRCDSDNEDALREELKRHLKAKGYHDAEVS